MEYVQELYSMANLTYLVLLILLFVVLQFAHQIVYYHFFHPLSVFPGPFWGGVTRLWIAWHNVRGTELAKTYALTKEYGPVVRITPTLLLIADSQKLPEFYHRNADKTEFYITGSFGETEALFNIRSHKDHATLRKRIATPVLHSILLNTKSFDLTDR
ncbi:cytochrome P450 monooxygenase [Penicillium hetheringtonii]|uniref:Cytochrome P450 monooxygenase n=1 Tax=Penicillium hetheringtonii TaxID=911720 RepID=A0AAD6DGB7_9EURO|nr:cytochrome P450 monooxygenase [Penicillium hetheringtonii]